MGMSELDSRLSLTLYTKCLGIPRAILEALELMGDGRLWFALVPALYVGHPDPNIRYICFNILTGLLLDLIIISLIKAIIKRPRPSYNKGMTIVVSVDKWSFPSGHSSRAFFIATIFYIFYHDGGFMGEIFHHIFMGFHHIVGVVVAWAIATSASRILLGRHYVFDVGAGALVGVLEALAVYHFLIVSPRFTEVVRGFVIGYPCSFRGYFPQFLAGLCKIRIPNRTPLTNGAEYESHSMIYRIHNVLEIWRVPFSSVVTLSIQLLKRSKSSTIEMNS